MNKFILSAISETLDRIASDISKEFIMAKLPTFLGNQKGRCFSSIYQIHSELKSGSFSTVYAATHNSSGERCAVKYTNRNKLCPQEDVGILSELYLLSSLDHTGICTVQDFFMENDGSCYVIMPLMEGGDVFDSIGRMKSYDENVARNLVRDLLRALSYLHGKNVVHCDLKSKNLFLRRKDDPSSVVLGDFGFATRVYFPKSLTRQCGTPYFVAPEVLLGTGYDTKADMWSLGVIVYSLLNGDLPFTGRTHLELFKKILGGQVHFEGDAWKDVSDVAKDLIQKLLVVDPCSRLSAMDALEHGWIRTDSRILRRNHLMNTSARLKTFNARLRLKSAMLAIRSVIILRNIAFHVKNT
jgi:serine/threonine protein kinase